MKRGLALFALILSGSVMAAQKAPASKPWAQEPDSFLGISFGQQIEGVLAKCPSGYQVPDQLCHEPRFGNGYTIKGLPDLGLRYRPQMMVNTGSDGVESFYLQTNSEDFSEVSKLFKARYGAPTSQQTDKVKTKGGGEFSNSSLTWRGASVMIRIVQYSGDIDTCAVSIVKTSSLDKSIRADEDKTKAAASKL